MDLNRKSREAIAGLIDNNGFSSQDFLFTKSKNPATGEINNRIQFKNSEYFFEFESYTYIGDFAQTITEYDIRYSPAEHVITGKDRLFNFHGIIKAINIWLGYLNEEINAYDPWDNYNFFNFNTGDEKFNENEIKAIAELSSKTIEVIKDLAQNDELVDELNNKINEINKNLAVLSKKQWYFFFKSQIATSIYNYFETSFDYTELGQRLISIMNSHETIQLLIK